MRVQTRAACRQRHTCICNPTPQRQPRGALATIDCPALLEASSGVDHKLEGFFLFYGCPASLTFWPFLWALPLPVQESQDPEWPAPCRRQNQFIAGKRLTTNFTKSTATCAPSGLSLTGDRVVSPATPLTPPLQNKHHLDITAIEWRMTALFSTTFAALRALVR